MLDPWLGEARHKHGMGGTTLVYRFDSSSLPIQRMRLKIEINTREQFTVLGTVRRRFDVDASWFAGGAEVVTFRLEELLGTKLRALYQRKKGRDLYDLWLALTTLAVDDAAVLTCFQRYLERDGRRVSRAEFESNVAGKSESGGFLDDVSILLAPGNSYLAQAALELVHERLIARLPGKAWKGT